MGVINMKLNKRDLSSFIVLSAASIVLFSLMLSYRNDKAQTLAGKIEDSYTIAFNSTTNTLNAAGGTQDVLTAIV